VDSAESVSLSICASAHVNFDMVEVFVSRLGLDSSTNSYVVILQEKGGERLLPIWIGKPEAESIFYHMHNVTRPRPITHDLIRSLVMGLGAQLRRAYISRVEDRTYYAELQLQRDDVLVNIDARPSDSIAIALRLNAPIFAHEDLLRDPTEDDDEEQEELSFEGEGTDAVAKDAESEMSAEELKRYLETLRPEDFGKFNP
jgi:bifunctional DNase/RNase